MNINIQNKISIALVLILIALFSTQCQEDLCEFINCQNGGNCVEESCECATGYTGKFCEENLHLLKTITFNETSVQNFEYDEMNRIVRRTFGSNSSISTEVKYNYLNDTIQFRFVYILDQDTVYHYLIDQSDFRMDYVVVDQFLNHRTKKYSNIDPNCGYFFGETYGGSSSFTPGTLQSYQEIDYFGNCSYNIRSYRAENDTLISTRELIMHGSNSIYQSAENRVVDLNYPYVTNKKNIETNTRYNSQGIVIENGSYTAEFLLNDDNYPVRETRTFLTGDVWEFQYEYY